MHCPMKHIFKGKRGHIVEQQCVETSCRTVIYLQRIMYLASCAFQPHTGTGCFLYSYVPYILQLYMSTVYLCEQVVHINIQHSLGLHTTALSSAATPLPALTNVATSPSLLLYHHLSKLSYLNVSFHMCSCSSNVVHHSLCQRPVSESVSDCTHHE